MIISGGKNTFSILGFNDTDQLSLRQIERLIYPEDQKSFISQFSIQNIIKSQEIVFRITDNNTTKHILSRSHPIKDLKNVLTGFKGTFQDVTYLMQDNAIIRDEKIFYNSIAENLQCPFQIISDNTVIFSNGKITELTGFSLKEINSKNISPFSYTVPEDLINLKKITDLVLLNHSQIEKTEIRIETKNNRIKWIDVTVSSIEIKDKKMILFLLSDISARKKAESELLASENQFKSIVSLSTNSIALVNQFGQFIYTNEAFLALTGYNHSDFKGKTCQSLFTEADFVEVSKGMESLTLSISKNYNYECNQFANNKGWVRLKILPLKTNENRVEYFIFYCNDIDLEKKKSLTLEEENQSLKQIKEYSPFGFAHFNNKRELLNFNNKFQEYIKLFTKSKSKITLSDIEKLGTLQNPAFHRSINENIPGIFEVNPTPDTFLQIEITPLTNNREKSILIFITDITKQKLKIDSLTLLLERFQGIFENAPLGMALIDKNRNIIISNHNFERYFEYNPNDLNFIRLDNLIDSQHLGENISKLSQLYTGVTNSFQQVLKMNKKNGETIWINANAASVKDNFGDSKYAILMVEDISQAKIEEQGLLANERLQTLNNIGNSFAHEFNNLLMGIYGNAYLLNSYLKDASLSQYTGNLLNSINQASELTHRLLSFSDRKNTLNIILNSNDLINDILGSTDLNDRIELRKTLNNNNELIIGDPYQLKRAFQYIIKNASESMPNGGILSIETNVVFFEPDENDDQRKIGKGKYLRITVSDTGPGIPVNDLNKIFDPFYSTKPSGLNTGLGLAIAKQIITSHNGIIKANNGKDKGSIFNIYIPIKEINKSISSIQPDERLIANGSVKILIVDDEEIVRLITSELLKNLGYDVYSFASGQKAIKFYKDNFSTIDLVLLDKHMPEMDGIEVFNYLKEINPSVKVFILTGYNINKEIENMFSNNLCGYIQKPVSIEKLSQSISDVLFK